MPEFRTVTLDPREVDPRIVEILSIIPTAVVAGGAARFAVLGAAAPTPGDIDVFLLDGTLPVAEKMTLLGWQVARTDVWQYHGEGTEVQFVRREHSIGHNMPGGLLPAWDSAESVIATFGFTCEMFALRADAEGNIVATLTQAAYDDTRTKTLIVNHVIDPIRLAYRANKYGLKGFSMSLPEMAKVFEFYSGALNSEQRTHLLAGDATGLDRYAVAA